LICIKS